MKPSDHQSGPELHRPAAEYGHYRRGLPEPVTQVLRLQHGHEHHGDRLRPAADRYRQRLRGDRRLEKGEELLAKYGRVREADRRRDRQAENAARRGRGEVQAFLDVPRERLPKLLEEAYDDPYWETKSKTCLSCGSCVMVCPTCFCFDVQDDVALNLKEGERFRQWDGCMLVDFAKVATGENFRHDKASRFRHRIFRKGKYILEKYGRFGCVGCGRCATACLAEIASPLEAFNAVAEVGAHEGDACAS